MAIFKNKSGQSIGVFAYDAATGAPKTGDAANITAYLSKDFGSPAATNDTNPTELSSANAPGWYVFDLTQAETNAEVLALAAKSSTAGVLVDPVQAFTADSTVATATALSTLDGKVATASALSTLDGKVATNTDMNTLLTRLSALRAGYLDKLNVAGVLANTDNAGTFKADVSGLATSAALSTVDGKIDALPGVADIADGLWDELLSGHAIAGSAGEALAQAASGSGGGGGGGLTKADVRDALGMAAANLDNQLDGLSNAIGAVGDQLDSVPYCTPGNPVTGGPGDMPRIDLRGVQGDTTQWSITGLDLTGATKVWITAKDALWKDDAHAVFQVDDAGLTVLAEQVAAHPEWGVLTIVDAGAGNIAVTLDENATRVVPGNVKLSLDIQKQTAGGITTIAIGTVEFRKDVTWTI